jgi:hypothetical protein
MGWRAMNFGGIVRRPEVPRTGSHRSGGPRKKELSSSNQKNRKQEETACPLEPEIAVNRKGGPPPLFALYATAGKQAVQDITRGQTWSSGTRRCPWSW